MDSRAYLVSYLLAPFFVMRGDAVGDHDPHLMYVSHPDRWRPSRLTDRPIYFSLVNLLRPPFLAPSEYDLDYGNPSQLSSKV